MALPVLAHLAQRRSVSRQTPENMRALYIKQFHSRGTYGGVKMLCYLHYFKLRNINVVTRFRKVVSWAPDEVLLVNATSGNQYTRQQVWHGRNDKIIL